MLTAGFVYQVLIVNEVQINNHIFFNIHHNDVYTQVRAKVRLLNELSNLTICIERSTLNYYV